MIGKTKPIPIEIDKTKLLYTAIDYRALQKQAKYLERLNQAVLQKWLATKNKGHNHRTIRYRSF